LTKPAPTGPFYTWFVGFAPSAPEVAISVMVANHLKWRMKATHVAADMLRVYFADKGAPGVRDPSDRDASARR
jgi:peptidoglycan glycosyltransferase